MFVVANSREVEEYKKFDCEKEVRILKDFVFNVKMGPSGPMGMPGIPGRNGKDGKCKCDNRNQITSITGKCECDIDKILSRIQIPSQKNSNSSYGLDFELRLKNLERDLRIFIKRSLKRNSKK